MSNEKKLYATIKKCVIFINIISVMHEEARKEQELITRTQEKLSKSETVLYILASKHCMGIRIMRMLQCRTFIDTGCLRY